MLSVLRTLIRPSDDAQMYAVAGNAVGAEARDWDLLANMMRALDSRVAQSQIIGLADRWALPKQLTGMPAHDYLVGVKTRLEEIQKAVKKARDSGVQKLKDAAEDVARIA